MEVTTLYIGVENVVVDDRIREEGKEPDAEFLTSFRRYGQLQPIVVEKRDDGRFTLRMGERRLTAIRKLYEAGETVPDLPQGMIRAEVKSHLSPQTALLIEFEENDKRKDFTYQEKAKWVRKMHESMKTINEKWTGEMTAMVLNISPASVSYYLTLDTAMAEHPEVGKAETMRAAIKRLKVIEEHTKRLKEAQHDNAEGIIKASEVIACQDARQWIKAVPTGSVDLINFDPPWGDEASHKVQENWASFDDSTEYSDEITQALLPELFRILKNDRFLIMWYRAWAYRDVCDLLEKQGFSLQFARTPCIWYKPDKVSDQNRYPEKQLISSYEQFIIARKGAPVFYEKEAQDVFVEPRTPKEQLIHPTEKPLALMERLVRLCSVPGETILDPTSGGAAFLVAGWKLHRRLMGCEMNPAFCEKSRLRLAEAMK